MKVATVRLRNRFYTAMGLAVTAITVIGFSRTYYLKEWFDPRPLTMRLHLHGLVLSAWVLLFMVQTRLIGAGRRTAHRRLGIAGAVLAVLVVVTTWRVALEAFTVGPAGGGVVRLDRLYSTAVVSAIFGLLVATGIVYRKRPETHKRLMLLAMITVVGPAASRAVALVAGHPITDSHIVVTAVLLLAALLYDWRTRGWPHPVMVWVGALLLASQMTRRVVGGSEMWTRTATWLISLTTCVVLCSSAGVTAAAQAPEDAAIQDVFAKFTKAWDAPGMPGFDDLFTVDADFVVITGRRLTGRDDIVTYHRALLNARYKGSRSLPMKVERVRFLSPDIAVAHVTSGARYMEDGQEFTRTGRATAILVRKDGTWRLTAFHNTLTGGPGAVVPR